MNTYQLKEKILITKEFLNDLETRSWQEVEYLQNQIANIETGQEYFEVEHLLKNLLTSYYVFIGGLENLSSTEMTIPKPSKADDIITDMSETKNLKELLSASNVLQESSTLESSAIEPFEYFVDFDEPSGEPLTDADLYNN